jgi:glucose/arabinose dehydrogenase
MRRYRVGLRACLLGLALAPGIVSAAAGSTLDTRAAAGGLAQAGPVRQASSERAAEPTATPVQAGEFVQAKAKVDTVADGLEHPWSLAFLPGGDMLITERPGRLRRLDAKGVLSAPIQGVPDVFAQGQGGLLDVLLSPGFEQDRRVYLSYAERGQNGRAGTAVGAGRLSQDGQTLEDFKVIFRQEPKLSTGNHFGGRMVFDREGYLFIALGENNQRPTSQDLDKLQGKIVRITADGSVPKDNPFVGQANARPEIWTYGMRNPQGMALNPWTGELWEHEHGPRGGDEVNIIYAGRNYGWPLATYGINYSGLAIPEAKGETLEGGQGPLYWWKKSPAISGMAFYDSDTYPAWKDSLFVGALASQALIRLSLANGKIVGEERLLSGDKARIRDVRLGPDGAIYVLTDEGNGRLLRVTPG